VVLRLRKGGVLMHVEQQTPEMPSFLISYTRDVLVPLFGNQYTGETVCAKAFCVVCVVPCGF